MAEFFLSDFELIRFEVFWVSLVGIWLLYSLFGIWVATRTWHWFLKFASIAAAATLLMLIEAYDLALMQLVNCMSVYCLHFAWKSFWQWKTTTSQSSRLNFGLSLTNLLLAVTAFAILMAIVSVDFPDGLETRQYSIGFGCAVGVAFMTGVAIGRVRSRWAILVAFLACSFGAFQAFFWIFPQETKSSLFTAMFGTGFIWEELESFAKAVLVSMVTAGWICGLLSRLKEISSGNLYYVSRMQIGFVAVVFVLFFAATIDVGIRLAYRYPAPESKQDGDSRFDKLVRIGERFNASPVFDSYPRANSAAFENALAASRDDFAEIRKIVDSSDSNPWRHDIIGDPFEFTDVASRVRSIARALSEESRVQFANGDQDLSLSTSVTTVLLREPVSENRVLVAELVALAIEGIGHYAAVESIPFASRQALSESLQRLLEFDGRPYDPETSYSNDNRVMWQWRSWWGRLFMLCEEKESRRVFEENVMEAIRRGHATRQQCIAMLALELYRSDHESYPDRLELLVPKYLPVVPQDPFENDKANANMKYRLIENGNDYCLYSIGFDREDDNGKLSEWGYGSTGDDGTDLNFREEAMVALKERDAEIEEADLQLEAVE